MAVARAKKHTDVEGRILSERGQISVAEIRSALGVSRERLGRVLDVSARTIQRWEDNDQLPTNKWILQVLVQIQNIVDVGLQVFEAEGFRRIMTQPMPGFDNRPGIELVESGEGDVVLGQLAGAYEGYVGS